MVHGFTKTNFARDLVSLDCPLRLLENFLIETALSFFFQLLGPVQCLGKNLYLIFCLIM